MIDHIEYLYQARSLFLELMKDNIINTEFIEELSQVRVNLNSGIIIYIKYNQFGEYGYQIIYSRLKNDMLRFDNYDDRWDVETRPHHFQERGNKKVITSPMNGTPEHDIPILVEYIKNVK